MGGKGKRPRTGAGGTRHDDCEAVNARAGALCREPGNAEAAPSAIHIHASPPSAGKLTPRHPPTVLPWMAAPPHNRRSATSRHGPLPSQPSQEPTPPPPSCAPQIPPTPPLPLPSPDPLLSPPKPPHHRVKRDKSRPSRGATLGVAGGLPARVERPPQRVEVQVRHRPQRPAVETEEDLPGGGWRGRRRPLAPAAAGSS